VIIKINNDEIRMTRKNLKEYGKLAFGEEDDIEEVRWQTAVFIPVTGHFNNEYTIYLTINMLKFHVTIYYNEDKIYDSSKDNIKSRTSMERIYMDIKSINEILYQDKQTRLVYMKDSKLFEIEKIIMHSEDSDDKIFRIEIERID
jgi:hypothetical protein